MALSPHFAHQRWLPTPMAFPQGKIGRGWGGVDLHTPMGHFGLIQTPPCPWVERDQDVTLKGLIIHEHV